MTNKQIAQIASAAVDEHITARAWMELPERTPQRAMALRRNIESARRLANVIEDVMSKTNPRWRMMP